MTTDLKHHVRHSPDGFEYGYGGSGPAELARCILLDFFEPDPDPGTGDFFLPVSYQTFKFDMIATLDRDAAMHVITGEEIAAWVEKQPTTELTS